MAAADWRTDALIASIRRRGNIPSSSSGWNDTDLLAALNEELRSYLVPLIRRVNEDYLVAYEDVSIVSGTASYRIPEDALGEALKDVGILDSSGNFQPLIRIDSGNRDVVSGYYLEDENIVLVPIPTATDTMRVKYIRRPSKLVGDERVIEITGGSLTGVDFGDYALDGTTATSVLALDMAAEGIDFVRSAPGFRCYASNLTGGAYSTGVIDSWTETIAEAPAAGDYLCYTGESPVPQVPAEAHPLLAQATLCQYLRATSQPGLQEAEARKAQMEVEVVSLFTPRTENQPKVVINRYGAGWTGTGRSRTWGR